jgi:uncharacterized protein DUF3761
MPMPFRSLLRGATVALIVAAIPSIARAQSSDQTVCKDGTTSRQTSASACDGHGGVDDLKTSMLRRKRILMGEPKPAVKAPESETPVTQAGTPAPAPRAGDAAAPRLPAPVPPDSPARERSNRDDYRYRPRNAVARCRDGTYDHGRGKKRKNICKHHGGIARWYGR